MTAATTRLPPVPFAPPSITEGDIDAVAAVMRSGWLSTGQECLAFEEELAEHIQAPHVVAMASCTAALEISLRSLHLEPGQRVGCPTWTFVSSAASIVRAGGVPVLIDVDEDTLNISPEAVEAALGDGLDGLVAVHFAGQPVDRAVFELASASGVPVVEDAAHALGSRDHRGPISGKGTVGACFSFYATKNLTSGEGGALATHDPVLASYARRIRLHGLSNDAWDRYRVGADPSYDVPEPGLKANLPDILAALGRSQLARFDQMQARRRELVRRYRRHVDALEGCRMVPSIADERSADHLCVVILPPEVDRAAVIGVLAESGIGVGIHFKPVHRMSWFEANAAVGAGGLGVADRLADRALSLPLHPGLSDESVERVIDVLVSALP